MVRHFINVVEPKLIFANKQSAGVALEVAKIGNTNIKVVCFDDYAHTIPFSEVLRDHDLSAVANFRCTEIDRWPRWDCSDTLYIWNDGFTQRCANFTSGVAFVARRYRQRNMEREITVNIWCSKLDNQHHASVEEYWHLHEKIYRSGFRPENSLWDYSEV